LKFLFPIASFALSLLFQLGFAVTQAPAIPDIIFIFWVAIYLPAVSFFYAKKFLQRESKKISYTLVHSFLHALSFFLFFFTRDGLFAAFVLFVWCELWALIGLIRKQKIPCF